MATSIEAARAAAAAAIERRNGDLRNLSLSIHANPELNFQEHHAHSLLTDYFEKQGFAVTRGAYGLPTAFEAVAGSGSPVIAVLCEYDALPGIGHACGHNLIAACGVATAVALKEALGEGQGTVVALGTPAEEGGGGKILLIHRGAFARVDAAMMLHPAPYDSAYMNVLALTHITVEYFGKNAHAAAAPWEGVNALDAMLLGFNAIAAMRQQILPTDRVHGVITNGGLKPNIIPDYTSAEFYVRSRNSAELRELRAKVVAALEGAAVSARCTVKVGEPAGELPYSDMAHNDVMADAYRKHFEEFELRLPPKAAVLGGPGASTDMGDVSYVVPSIHPTFAIPTDAGNHTPGFTAAAAKPEAHEAAMRSATALANTALDLYLEAGVLDAAKREFAKIRRS